MCESRHNNQKFESTIITHPMSVKEFFFIGEKHVTWHAPLYSYCPPLVNTFQIQIFELYITCGCSPCVWYNYNFSKRQNVKIRTFSEVQVEWINFSLRYKPKDQIRQKSFQMRSFRVTCPYSIGKTLNRKPLTFFPSEIAILCYKSVHKPIRRCGSVYIHMLHVKS